MKRNMFVFFSAMILVTAFFIIPQESIAQTTIPANVTIERIIQTGTAIQFRGNEVNGVFANKLFQINDNPKQNVQTAIILTAISLNQPVRIFFVDSGNANTGSDVSSVGMLVR